MRYWLGVVSEDHVQRGVAGGFAQVCHGKRAPLQRISAGDWLIYYSPRTSMKNGQLLQSFTAVGQAVDDDVFAVQMTPTFRPYRRRINFSDCVPVKVEKLKKNLELTQQPNWGYKLRFGLIELSENDFVTIQGAMQNGEGLEKQA